MNRLGDILRADFPVVLDACVLAEAAVSDLFLRLAEEPRLLLPKWTEQIWIETENTCINKLGWPPEIATSRISSAKNFFPEAMVFGYESLISECTNHPNDRHVLAAAIFSKTETIVSFNTKDFPTQSLDPWGIVVAHPAEYLKVLFDHDQAAVVNALHGMADTARKTFPEMLARLAWYVRPFSVYIADETAVNLPEISPILWRRD